MKIHETIDELLNAKEGENYQFKGNYSTPSNENRVKIESGVDTAEDIAVIFS